MKRTFLSIFSKVILIFNFKRQAYILSSVLASSLGSLACYRLEQFWTLQKDFWWQGPWYNIINLPIYVKIRMRYEIG